MKLLLILTLFGPPALADDATADDAAAAASVGEPTPLAEPPLNPPPATDAEIDHITDDVSSGLRCPVCQGLSVNDSPAEGARTMKARIRELVAMGYTREQIDDYFVDRYGTWVLLAPPASGTNWTVYIAPAAFLVFGFGSLAWFMRSRPASPTDAEPAPPSLAAAQADDELEPYRQRILAELGLASSEESA